MGGRPLASCLGRMLLLAHWFVRCVEQLLHFLGDDRVPLFVGVGIVGSDGAFLVFQPVEARVGDNGSVHFVRGCNDLLPVFDPIRILGAHRVQGRWGYDFRNDDYLGIGEILCCGFQDFRLPAGHLLDSRIGGGCR